MLTERLSQLLRIDQSTETPRLLLKTPGLLEILSGNVEIIASDGQLSTSQSFDLELIPSAEMVSINASPPRRYDTQGESVPLGKLLQAQPLFFEDEADTTELEINSSQPVRVHLSDSFRALAGLSAAEAGRLERQWQNIDASGEDSDTTQLTIPISELLALLADNGDVLTSTGLRSPLNPTAMVPSSWRCPPGPGFAVMTAVASASSKAHGWKQG